MALKTQVGLNIRCARNAAGMTIEELADRVDKSAVAIGQIERGKAAPSFKTLEDITRALKIPAAYLFPSSVGQRVTAKERIVAEITARAVRLVKEDAETLNIIAKALLERGQSSK